MDAINTERQIRETADWHKGSLDITRQKLPFETAYMQSQIAENNANAQRLKNLGTGANNELKNNKFDASTTQFLIKELDAKMKDMIPGTDEHNAAQARREELISHLYSLTPNSGAKTTPPPADPMAALKAQAAAILATRPK